jgi:hypothetical protein
MSWVGWRPFYHGLPMLDDSIFPSVESDMLPSKSLGVTRCSPFLVRGGLTMRLDLRVLEGSARLTLDLEWARSDLSLSHPNQACL